MKEADCKILFEDCKNGDKTCSFNGKYLHSKYNPVNEGERFAQNVQADFSPLCIFVIEPALSYCALPLKKRFPSALLYAIRFRKDFKEWDGLWDKVIYLYDLTIPLGDFLFSSVSEDKLCSALVLDWQPSKQIFPSENQECWQEIKKAIINGRNVIATRSFFSKRWLKNSIIFSNYIRNPFSIKKGSCPIVIAASGPSLASSLPYIKTYRESFFLIALSSAYICLLENALSPDMVISSDGGFWAKKHLDFPGRKDKPLFAIESEGAIPKKILTEEKILPLYYEDGIERFFLESLKIPACLSERNGTVAGTALNLALSLTSGNIYLCGLDQAPSIGFQHSQPNALELSSSAKDFRLGNGESRITSSRFNSSASLQIYRNWFVTNSSFFKGRVFRLSHNYSYDFSLGELSDIGWNFFERNEKGKKRENIQIKSEKIDENINRKEILLSKLKEISAGEHFKNEVFPMESLMIKREAEAERKAELEESLKVKIQAFILECENIFIRREK
ncbi:MAG: DUF115 domain-containing protein [Treponema sp.]|nr:DUF115 domain-containing protein [Treponema sp.]